MCRCFLRKWFYKHSLSAKVCSSSCLYMITFCFAFTIFLKRCYCMLGFSSLPDGPNVDWDTKIASQLIADHIKHNQFQMVR